jgi:hypothetical protein
MYRIDVQFDTYCDYIIYWDDRMSPSECHWMIPGTWVDD